MTNAFSGYVAGHFMELERQRQTLLTGHALVPANLFLQCFIGLHIGSRINLTAGLGVVEIESARTSSG